MRTFLTWLHQVCRPVVLGLILLPALPGGAGLAPWLLSQTSASSPTDRIAALKKTAVDNATVISAARSAGDNARVLTPVALVLQMSGPGLALFYGGLVRRKNVLGTMMQIFAMMAVVTVLWKMNPKVSTSVHGEEGYEFDPA